MRVERKREKVINQIWSRKCSPCDDNHDDEEENSD